MKIARYKWLLEIIAAALLLVLGIVIYFEAKLVLYITATLFIFLGIARFIPLLKTTKDKLLKLLYFLEIIIDVAAGVFILSQAQKVDTLGNVFGYIIGGVLYLRGFMHLYSTAFKNEPNVFLNFVFHIILLSLGVVIFIKGNVDSKLVGYVILAIILLCVLYLLLRGMKHYRTYRGIILEEQEMKRLKKEEKEANKKAKEEKKAPSNKDIYPVNEKNKEYDRANLN